MHKECWSKHSINALLDRNPLSPPPSIYAACLLIIAGKIRRGKERVKSPSGMTDHSESRAIWHFFPLFKRTTGSIPHNPPSRSQHNLPFSLLWWIEAKFQSCEMSAFSPVVKFFDGQRKVSCVESALWLILISQCLILNIYYAEA